MAKNVWETLTLNHTFITTGFYKIKTEIILNNIKQFPFKLLNIWKLFKTDINTTWMDMNIIMSLKWDPREESNSHKSPEPTGNKASGVKNFFAKSETVKRCQFE